MKQNTVSTCKLSQQREIFQAYPKYRIVLGMLRWEGMGWGG